jgi:LysM repeat protein
MKQWKRIIYYLMINVLLSACTTLAVLYAWDRSHNPTPGGLFSVSVNESTPTPTRVVNAPALAPTPTQVFVVYQVQDGDTFQSIAEAYNVTMEELIAENGFTQDQPLGEGEVLRIPVQPTPSPEPQAEIANVLGVGDLDSERVVIRQVGEGEILLAGWQLEDEQGDIFTFPTLELVKDGFEVQVYTRVGTNTADSLYWGLDHTLWASGNRMILRDADGNLQATFEVP